MSTRKVELPLKVSHSYYLHKNYQVLASLRDTSHAITRLERVVAGDVGVDSAERLATEINQVHFRWMT